MNYSDELNRRNFNKLSESSGATTRTRTADLLITNQLLYQLSYRGAAEDLGQKIYLCKPYLCAFAKRNIAPKDSVMMSRAAGVDPWKFSRLACS